MPGYFVGRRAASAAFLFILVGWLTAAAAAGQRPEQLAASKAADDAYAKCLGLTPEEYRVAFSAQPGEGEQQRVALKKVNSLPKKQQQDCHRARQDADMGAAGTMMGDLMKMAEDAQRKMAGDGGMTEAPGQSLVMAEDVLADLKAGKTVVRGIDWNATSGDVSEAGRGAFVQAMAKVGSAMRQLGGTYRIDFFVDSRYDDDTAQLAAGKRLAVLKTALAPTIGEAVALTLGKARRDKQPRLEIVRP